MRPRISIRGRVRPSVGPSVRMSRVIFERRIWPFLRVKIHQWYNEWRWSSRIWCTPAVLVRFNYASSYEVVFVCLSVCLFIHPSICPSVCLSVRSFVPCYFLLTIVAIFEEKKSSNDILINDTMSDDIVVASDDPHGTCWHQYYFYDCFYTILHEILHLSCLLRDF